MKAKSDNKIKETEEWKNKYLRALADYQNLERRIREERVLDKKYAVREVILNILPIINDLIKAQMEINNPGIKLILDKIDAFLKNEKIEKVECLNKKFSPDFMECVGLKEGFKDDEVVEQVRPAYLINGEIMLPAQVIVGQEKKEEQKSSTEEKNN